MDIPLPDGKGEQHVGILKNFTNAILNDERLIAPAGEGIHSVELANAMLFSAFEKTPVDLPLDGAAYERVLQTKISESTYVKPEVKADKIADLTW